MSCLLANVSFLFVKNVYFQERASPNKGSQYDIVALERPWTRSKLLKASFSCRFIPFRDSTLMCNTHSIHG